MANSYVEVYEMLKERGLDSDIALEAVRKGFGARAAAKVEAAEEEARLPKKLQGSSADRNKRALRQWRDMRLDVKKKRYNAEQGAREKPDEAHYFSLLAKTCEKLEAILASAEAEAQAHPAGVQTPVQVGASLGLPNSGLNWPDWVPEKVKARVLEEAGKVAMRRPRGSRLPRPFFISERDSAEARKRALSVALEQQREGAHERMRLLIEAHPNPDVNKKRQITAVCAEIAACDSALNKLPTWPRTRPVPVHPLDLIGARMPTILERVERIAFVDLEKASAVDCVTLGSRCVVEAVKQTLGRKRFVKTPSRKLRVKIEGEFARMLAASGTED